MYLQAIQAYFQVFNLFLAQVRLFPYMGARGPGASQKIGFLLISCKVSQCEYMLLHKLYINLAIAVIFTLFSSLSDLSMKICPIRRVPPCIL